MSIENQKRMLNILRQALLEIDRLSQTTSGESKTVSHEQNFTSVKHDITIVVSMLWQFLKEVEASVRVLKMGEEEEEIPVFAMMNNMLFNQKRFRNAITKIMGIFYKCHNSETVTEKDSQIIILGQIIEALAVYIKISRHELHSEDEIFSNTIALMKINRVLQLKELKFSELDAYHDFSVERAANSSETNIANCLATGDKTGEAQQAGDLKLRKLRRLIKDIGKLKTAFEDFNSQFTNLLYTKLEFSLLWKEALASKNYGYAVECYAEKCCGELEEAKTNVDEMSVVTSKLDQAEKLLMELERKAVASSSRNLNNIDGLGESLKEILPLITFMCLSVTGKKFKQLIGEINLRKYREMKSLIPKEVILKEPKEPKVTQLSRGKSLFKSMKGGEWRGPSRVTKIAEYLGFGTHEVPKQGAKKRSRRQSCSHQDIVDEYDYAFTQTLIMLENGEPSIS